MTKITRRGFVKSAALAPLALSSLNSMAQNSAPSDRAGTSDKFDVVVAGAGHNSMIAAAYLAKAGYEVVLLEGRPTVGGLGSNRKRRFHVAALSLDRKTESFTNQTRERRLRLHQRMF